MTWALAPEVHERTGSLEQKRSSGHSCPLPLTLLLILLPEFATARPRNRGRAALQRRVKRPNETRASAPVGNNPAQPTNQVSQPSRFRSTRHHSTPTFLISRALAQPKHPSHPTLTTLIPVFSLPQRTEGTPCLAHFARQPALSETKGGIPRPHPQEGFERPEPAPAGSGTARVERTLLSAAFDLDSDSACGDRNPPGHART